MGNYKLSDENINEINAIMEDNKKSNEDLKSIAELPSNNGVEESKSNEEGYTKLVDVSIDPISGENKILGNTDNNSELDDAIKEINSDSFEDILDKIENEDTKYRLEDEPNITEKELEKSLKESTIIDPDKFNISDKALTELLVLVNRKKNNQKINPYRDLPDEVKSLIDDYLKSESGIVPNNYSVEANSFRNFIADNLIDEFICNITIARSQNDFNKDIEKIFTQGRNEMAEYAVGYSEERNKKYREYLDKLEDQTKKEKLAEVLDTIDSAYSLDNLKEFAKKCKIKKYDLENPNRYFNDFLYKYKDSEYNIYNINMTVPILERNININEFNNYNTNHINAFLVCFCKYVMNYNVNNVLEHAFMYYFIYNIVLIDANKSEKTKDVSDKFILNIHQVIDNIIERNSSLF